MVMGATGVTGKREAGAWNSCGSEEHSNYVTSDFYSISGTLGQRGCRVTGKWVLYKGGKRRSDPSQMDTYSKTVNKQGEMSSLSEESTGTTSSPGRARRVSMKIKKGFKEGFKEVKEILSPHHHHHHHHHPHHPDGHGEDQQHQQQRRRKSGPTESPRRGPLAPVLDHLEKHNSVPIHLHISHKGSFSISRKGSSSSYSCSDIVPDESATLDDIHQHIEQQQQAQALVEEQEEQEQQPSSKQEEPLQPELESVMETEVPEPYVTPPSPQRSNDGEETPNPFLVDDPEDPLSDPGSPSPAPALPLDSGSLVPDSSPSESVALSPAPSQLPLPSEPAPPRRRQACPGTARRL
jgi:hypothetical protein